MNNTTAQNGIYSFWIELHSFTGKQDALVGDHSVLSVKT